MVFIEFSILSEMVLDSVYELTLLYSSIFFIVFAISYAASTTYYFSYSLTSFIASLIISFAAFSIASAYYTSSFFIYY